MAFLGSRIFDIKILDISFIKILIFSPDGGYKTKWGRFWAWVGSGFKWSFTNSDNPGTPWHKYGIVREIDDGLSFDFGLNNGGHKELIDYGYQVNNVNYFNNGYGFMREFKPNKAGQWKESDNILKNFCV